MAENFREPQSANEALLQNILGAENEIREPQSVTEYYLKKILEQGGGSEVVANPETTGGEADLTALQVGDTKYLIPAPTEIVANPEVPSGTTPTALETLQLGEDYYSVGGGGDTHLYMHEVQINITSVSAQEAKYAYATWCSASPIPITTIAALKQFVLDHGYYANGWYYLMINGVGQVGTIYEFYSLVYKGSGDDVNVTSLQAGSSSYNTNSRVYMVNDRVTQIF